MKFKTILLFLLIAAQQSYSQDLNSLKVNAENIYKYTINLDYDKILETTYQKLFEIVPKDEIKQILVTTFSGSDEVKVKIINIPPNFRYGKIKKIEDHTFCLIEYDLAMEFEMIGQQFNKSEGIQIAGEMKKAMDAREVTFNEDTNTFTIKKRSDMIGIWDDSTNNQWQFLNRDKDNVLAKYLFSKKVISELGL